MASTLTVCNPKVVYSPEKMATTTEYCILNGQSWKAGQFLYVDSSGLLNTCASDGTDIKFYALKDQTDPGNNTTKAEVGVITQDTVFEGNELDGTLAATNLLVKAAIDVTNNIVTVDVTDAGNDAVIVTELGSTYNPILYKTDDIKAKCKFKVIPAALEDEA